MSEQAQHLVVQQDGLNYYNYFTEVEEAFVSRRGAPMLISPLDWALIESWKDMGIPLHIVLRGIIKSFENYNPEVRGGKRVNTLFYCQQEVLSNFKDYVESQVGAGVGAPATSKEASGAFPRQELVGFIDSRRQELEEARKHAEQRGLVHLQEALWRATIRLTEIIDNLSRAHSVNTESLERDLTLLEETIYAGLLKDVPPAELDMVRAEAEEQLKPHKKRMEAEVYKQTLENYIAKRLREQHFIARLSLFYM